MKAVEYREKSAVDLRKELMALLREQFNLRMQRGTSQLKKPHHLQRVRREIARIRTILHEQAAKEVGGVTV